MSDLVGNTEDRVSNGEAHIVAHGRLDTSNSNFHFTKDNGDT